LGLVLVGVLACDKGKSDPGAAASASAASAAPSASVAVPKVKSNDWKGTYTAERASYYLPDSGEYKGVKFRGDDAGDALGEGTLSLKVDADGIVTGEGAGALGAVLLHGVLRGDDLTFTVSRKDPADLGVTGTGLGTVTGDAVEGTMQLSAYRAQIIREAKFKLSRQ
ncbi:MAG TPA: hypothetical protein VF316_14390, partial [Polyangiaceae bacterium]